jgi:hypothetical protein
MSRQTAIAQNVAPRSCQAMSARQEPDPARGPGVRGLSVQPLQGVDVFGNLVPP